MKITSRIKRLMIVVGVVFTSHTLLHGQNDLINLYLEASGDYARIYNGELEPIYSSLFFENDPYYISSDYALGDIEYRGNYYPNQNLRLDLYAGNLIILTPDNKLGVIIDPNHLGYARIHDHTIIYHVPSSENELKRGYYLKLYGGKELMLLCRINCMSETVTGQVKKRFSQTCRYFIVKDGEYYQVKNKKSFTKLFPAYKRQINRYVKENKLSFSVINRGRSLAKLAHFYEEQN